MSADDTDARPARDDTDARPARDDTDARPARDDATLAQIRAAEPTASTWLSANAGSGKTRVLTDRVARLLLRGVSPQRILCLTYTKAAASEMQNRLFKRLGEWAMKPDADLAAELDQIGHEGGADTATLAEARRLFARAIEAPGGLKIQTIHSFCASLLRRFPLEAGLTPAFVEMDDRTAKALRGDILERMAGVPGGRAALEMLAVQGLGEDFDALLSEICARADAFAGPVPQAELNAALGLEKGFDEGALLAGVFLGSEGDLLRQMLPFLDQGSKRDMEAAEKLRSCDLDVADVSLLEFLEGMLLTGAGAKAPFAAKIGTFPTKATQNAMGTLIDPLNALMGRVETARPLRLALAARDRALALHGFARAFLPLYEHAKSARGWLDFDDLIQRAGHLLSDPGVAGWVLFKLDGGVDHILVDEAQDTSPAQWRVIENLAQEFTAGQGARDASRTLFVVGDKKQSIYSFQGADLAVFDAMQTRFDDKLDAVGVRLNCASLEYSFRSSDAVLRLVDTAFAPPNDTGLGGAVGHIAFFDALPGRVDLWPALEAPEKAEKQPWFDPVDITPKSHPIRQLARSIAGELRRMIEVGTMIPTEGGTRPMTEGDVLVLVRRRGPLFHEIISACKAEGLAIAGADRLRLGGEMAVRDLTALLSFLDLPEDDLSLAACLRSPLLGWSEDQLFRLAQPRGRTHLWQALRGAGPSEALDILRDLRDQTDFLRPYELIERALTRHDGRRRLIARLGHEAEDGIDAFLAQALAYEQLGVPSLTGFLAWLGEEDVQVKRQLDTASRELRVMTVHGAKGLEAPVVILPDTMPSPARTGGNIVTLGDTVAWKKGPKDETPAPLQAEVDAVAELRAQEDARLLYVAMTRAESWLIVAGARNSLTGACWYDQIAAGLQDLDAVGFDTPLGRGLRHAYGDWPSADPAQPDDTPTAPDLPDWIWQPASSPARAAALLSPSDLGGAKALPGEGAEYSAEDALARGRGLHLLLEHLPLWPRGDWARLGRDLLSASEDGLPDDPEALLAEAAAVFDAPHLARLFAPGTLAEVEITADLSGHRMLGVIDRLVIGADHVLAVDYKSNRLVPGNAEDVPEGLLRQMAAYGVALAQVFPEKRIDLALLWTATAELMPLPDDLLASALERAALDPLAGQS